MNRIEYLIEKHTKLTYRLINTKIPRNELIHLIDKATEIEESIQRFAYSKL